MKTLCVYCTRTGLTKQIAETIAKETDAELLCVTDGKDRKGFFGYIAAAGVGLRKKLPALLPYKTQMPVAEYDRVIVAAPIWCEDVCPVARQFLSENTFGGDVAYVVTHMSPLPYDKKTDALEKLVQKKPIAVLTVQTRKHDWTEEVKDFIQKVKA